MKKLSWFAIVLCGLVGVAAFTLTASADHHEDSGEESAAKVIAVPIEDQNDLLMTGRSTLLRIPVSAMGGSQFSDPKIEGPAKLVEVVDVVSVGKDGIAVGESQKEYVFKGTGAGEVTISIGIQLPTGGDAGVRYKVTWQ